MRSFLLVCLLVLPGCRAETPKTSEAGRRLQLIAQLFNRYTSSHRGQTPANEKVFKEYINGLSASEKTAQGITSVDELLTSPTDQKPFIIRYGLIDASPGLNGGINMAPGKGQPASSKAGGSPNSGPNNTSNRRNLFAAEASGAKRYVVFATGQVEQLDESEVLKLLK